MKSIVVYLARTKRFFMKLLFKCYDAIFGSDKYIRYTHHSNGFHNPYYRFSKDQIAFVHIPKTGGTSFNKMLKESNDSRFTNLDIHKPSSVHCDPTSYQYITILRDPIDRVWSQYQMVLRSNKGYPYQKYAKKGLKSFLDNCWAVRNMTCRYISGEISQEPSHKTLKRAEQNLTHFYQIISFDSFADEVSSFFLKENITFNAVPNERKSSYVKPTTSEIELIKKYNELDVQLYRKWKESITKS